MVSNALLGFASFASGFAETYSAIEGPRFARLKAAEADREIRLENNSRILTQLFENSPDMQDVPSEDKDKIIFKMSTVFNPTTISNLAAAQAQGHNVFRVGSGPFTAGKTSIGIANLTSQDLTETEEKRNTAQGLMAQLASAPTREERFQIWQDADPTERLLTDEYMSGGTGKQHSTKYTIALRDNLIIDTDRTLGLDPGLGTYEVNWANEETGKIMDSHGIDRNIARRDPKVKSDLINKIINSRQVTDSILYMYAMSLGPMNAERQAIMDANNADRNSVQKGFEQILGDLSTQTLLPTDSGPPVSSTQLITTNGVQYLNQFNQSWFRENIPNAHSLHYTRQTMLEQMKNQILTKFNNNKWISSESTQVTDIIMGYISEQYDLAAEEMSQ